MSELLGVIGGSIALATLVVKWGYQRWTAGNAVMSAILDEAKIADILKKVREDTGAQRATVIIAHNGGKLPTIGDALYSTAMWGCGSSELPSLVSSWSGRRLDFSAINVLRSIILTKDVILRADELHPGIVRDMYESHGVRTGVAMALASRMSWADALMFKKVSKYWAWLCVDWVEDVEYSAAQKDAVSQAAASLTDILYGRGWGRYAGSR